MEVTPELAIQQLYRSLDNIISASSSHIIAIDSNGHALAAGSNYYSECNVNEPYWNDLVKVVASYSRSLAMINNGKILCTGSVET